jgi:hypothetical protein
MNGKIAIPTYQEVPVPIIRENLKQTFILNVEISGAVTRGRRESAFPRESAMPVVSLFLREREVGETLWGGSVHHTSMSKGFQERKAVQAGGKR